MVDLLVAHLVGDYLLQNDWMALGKKSSSFRCTVHVLMYSLMFVLLALLGRLEWWQVALIAAQHWIQDRTGFIPWYMAKIGQTNFAKEPCAPWSIFVVDNSVHILWMWLVFNLATWMS